MSTPIVKLTSAFPNMDALECVDFLYDIVDSVSTVYGGVESYDGDIDMMCHYCFCTLR
jgi:hypothetical protein